MGTAYTTRSLDARREDARPSLTGRRARLAQTGVVGKTRPKNASQRREAGRVY
jgi:hypothetical protein